MPYQPVPASVLDPSLANLIAGTRQVTTTNRQIVWLQWADIHMSEGGWQELDKYEDDGEMLVDTVGFLIPVGDPGSKDRHVTVWQTLCRGEAIHAIHIPVENIRHIKILAETM